MQPENQPSAPEPVAPAAQPPVSTPAAPITAASVPTKKSGLWFAIASLALFVVGLFLGFAALAGALLGGYAIQRGRKSGHKLTVILGVVGLVLNVLFYFYIVGSNNS